MPGGRRTHEFPHDKPPLLLALEIVGVGVGLFWVFSGALGWIYMIATAATFLSVGVVHARIIKRYEKSGQAVRIPRSNGVRFPYGVPKPMQILRVLFFPLAASLLIFGLAPLPDWIGHAGVAGSCVGLIVIGLIYVYLEMHYVKTGRAIEEFES